MTPSLQQAQGLLLGLAMGDAFNAPFEGGPLERLVWALIGKTRDGKRRYTDDTRMSLDLAECLLANDGLDLDDLSRRFASHYQWSRGYGGGAAKLLKRIERGEHWEVANRAIYPAGSFGNGGAMRAPVIGLWFCASDHLTITTAARDSARITHAHEQGMQGAVAIAHAVTAALHEDASPHTIMSAATRDIDDEHLLARMGLARDWLDEAQLRSPRELRSRLGNGMTALTSCATALYIACAHLSKPFQEMLSFARSCGGDTDTIGAMSGAIWGAVHGVEALPPRWMASLEEAPYILQVATSLHEAVVA